MAPRKTQRAQDLLAGRGSSAWLTVFPLQDLGFNPNKREFRDAVRLRYDWPVEDIPSTCACGEAFTVDHSMICKLGGFITQRHNELRDLEAEFLSMVCNDVYLFICFILLIRFAKYWHGYRDSMTPITVGP